MLKAENLADQIYGLCKKIGPDIKSTDGRIIAIAMVRNEEDIIERFVRHCLTWADALLVIDHASCDDTSSILQKLVTEGLCMGVVSDDAVGKHQADRMTLLARAAAVHLSAGVVVPLDADEFLVSTGNEVRMDLMALPSGQAMLVRWRSYVPTPDDDVEESDVLRRVTHRAVAQSEVTKVIFRGEIAAKADFRIGHGSHWLFSDGEKIAGSAPDTNLHFAHFPVRSAGQITAKTLMTPLVGLLDQERFPSAQVHYSILRDRAPVHSYMSQVELQNAALNYGIFSGETSPDLVRDPIKDTSGPLRYTPVNRVDAAYRLEKFARLLVEKLVGQPQLSSEPVALRELISAENDRLRLEVESLRARLANSDERLAALRGMVVFRAARWGRNILKRLLQRS